MIFVSIRSISSNRNVIGAGGGTRTHTPLLTTDFESFNVFYTYLFLVLNNTCYKAQKYRFFNNYPHISYLLNYIINFIHFASFLKKC